MSEPLTKDKIDGTLIWKDDLKSALREFENNINKEISNAKIRPNYDLGLVKAFEIMKSFPCYLRKGGKKMSDSLSDIIFGSSLF